MSTSVTNLNQITLWPTAQVETWRGYWRRREGRGRVTPLWSKDLSFNFVSISMRGCILNNLLCQPSWLRRDGLVQITLSTVGNSIPVHRHACRHSKPELVGTSGIRLWARDEISWKRNSCEKLAAKLLEKCFTQYLIFKTAYIKTPSSRKKWSCKTKFINKTYKKMGILFTTFKDKNNNYNVIYKSYLK